MDTTDRQLLTLLQENCKLSYNELGKQVGLSVSAVNERLKKMQAAGIIRGNVALVSPRAVGLDLCIFMQVLSDRPKNDPIISRMREMPEVLECHHITGEFSYLLKIRTRNTEHFETLVQQIKSLPGVTRTYTLVVLSSPKETTVMPLYDREPQANA